jgi:hypothetical protein
LLRQPSLVEKEDPKKTQFNLTIPKPRGINGRVARFKRLTENS